MPDLLLELFSQGIPALPPARSEARTGNLMKLHAEGVH